MVLDVSLVKRISEDSIARKTCLVFFFFFRMHGDGGYLVRLLSVYSIFKSMIMV